MGTAPQNLRYSAFYQNLPIEGKFTISEAQELAKKNNLPLRLWRDGTHIFTVAPHGMAPMVPNLLPCEFRAWAEFIVAHTSSAEHLLPLAVDALLAAMDANDTEAISSLTATLKMARSIPKR